MNIVLLASTLWCMEPQQVEQMVQNLTQQRPAYATHTLENQASCPADIAGLVRDRFEDGSFLHNLLSCFYCVSVWVAGFQSALFIIVSDTVLSLSCIQIFAVWILLWMFSHRVSNIVHEAILRWLERFPLWITGKTEIVE